MPGPVLGDADAVAVGDARIAVGHVRRVLLVRDADEADARRLEDVERVHVGGADDPEHVLHAVGGEGFDERFAAGHPGHGGPPCGLIVGCLAELCSKRNDWAHF